MKQVIIALVVLALVGCGGSAETLIERPTEPYHVSIDPAKMSADTVRMSDVFSQMEYVKLEAVKGHLVGNIKNVWLTEEYIFVHSEPLNPSGILQFARDGKFIRRIGSYGRGPGEYLFVSGIVADEATGTFMIICTFPGAVLRYDYAGKFLGSVNIKRTGSELAVVGTYPLSNYIAFDEPSAVRYISSPPNSDNYTAFFAIDPASGQIVHEQRSDLFDKSVYTIKTDNARTNYITWNDSFWTDPQQRFNYWEFSADTVWTVDSSFARQPKVIFEHGETTPTFEQLTKGGNFMYMVDLPTKVVKYRVYETPRYIFTDWLYGRRIHTSAFDKGTGETLFCNSAPLGSTWKEARDVILHYGNLINDFDGGLGHGLTSTSAADHWLYVVDAVTMKETLNGEHFNAQAGVKGTWLREFVSSLQEDDNPVLIFAHLKKED